MMKTQETFLASHPRRASSERLADPFQSLLDGKIAKRSELFHSLDNPRDFEISVIFPLEVGDDGLLKHLLFIQLHLSDDCHDRTDACDLMSAPTTFAINNLEIVLGVSTHSSDDDRDFLAFLFDALRQILQFPHAKIDPGLLFVPPCSRNDDTNDSLFAIAD